MSEPTPTLDAYIEAGQRVANAWALILDSLCEEIQTSFEQFVGICFDPNDEGYTYELMFPEGKEEWDIFV